MNSRTPDREKLEALCTQVRRDILRMVFDVQSGHPGGSLGCTEYFVGLFAHQMRHQPKPWDADGRNQDLFFLSNGHISPVFYSVLARTGYFELAELATFRKLHSRLQGHPATLEGLPGVRIATGSLGQGVSVAIGAAQAKKLNADAHLVYALMGDGEAQEGQIWEALNYAAHHQVDNLVLTVDLNFQQIDGPTRVVLNTDSLAAKFRAFNWEVLEELNGNSFPAVLSTLAEAQRRTGQGKPVAIMLHTTMGYGVDFMAGTHHWHGVAPNAEQLARALAQLPETLGDYPGGPEN
jgi:transketolase